MRAVTIVTAVIVVMLTGLGFMLKSNTTGATQAPRPADSSFELMSKAKDLPVAPIPDAF